MLFVAYQCLTFAQTDVTTQLIPDPGFEAGNTENWIFASDFGALHADEGGTYNGVFTITGDPEDVAVGDSAAKIIVTEGISMWQMGPRSTVSTADLSGKTLTISFRVKKTWPDETTQEDNPGIGKVMMKVYANGTAIEAHPPIPGLDGSFGFGNGEVLVDNGADYKVAGFQAAIPDGTTELQIGFWMGKYGTFYLDDFQIYEGGLTPALTAPEMPQEFQADPAEGTSTELLWLNNSEVVTSFIILRNGVPIDTVGGDQDTYEATGLNADIKYTFGIFALNGQISSDTATTVFNPSGQEEPKYTVTFDDFGNTSTAEANVNNEYKVTLPDAPSRYGYDFGGWFTEQFGAGTEFTAEIVVDADMTIYAKWTPSTLPSNDVTADLISNPGFENDTIGWAVFRPGGFVATFSTTDDEADVAEGSSAGKIEVTAGGNFWDMHLRSDTLDVDLSGKSLAISFKSKRLWETGEKKTIIKVKHPDGALWLTPIEDHGFANGECYYDENNQNEYKLFGFTFNVPDTVKSGLFIELWVGAEGTYFFDDFQVYEGLSPAFVDTLATSISKMPVSNNEFILYPNPVKDRLYVQGISEELQWTIISITGAVISTGRTNNINVSSLNSGYYFIRLENDEGVFGVERFIKL